MKEAVRLLKESQPFMKKTVAKADRKVEKFINDGKSFMEENLPIIIGYVATGVSMIIILLCLLNTREKLEQLSIISFCSVF